MTMREIIRNRTIELIEAIHLRIFGHPIGLEMKKFLVNLSWSFFGGIISSVVILAINIFVGRLIGPEEYGKYSLALVIVNYLFILIFFGIDISSVRAIAKSKNKKEISQNMTSSAYFVFISTIIVSIMVLLLAKPLASAFSTDSHVVIFAILLSIFTGTKLLFNGYIQGVHRFKDQFIGRMVETLFIVLAFIVLFVFLRRYLYDSYVIVISAGAIATSLFYYLKLKPYFHKFDKTALLKQLSYGKLFLISSILSTIFLSIDKLVINKYMDVVQLGIYMAYYTVSINLMSQLSQMFNNVFMPTIAKNLNKEVFSKLEKIIYLSFLPLFALVTLVVYITIMLFGSKYGFALNLVFGFGIFGLLKLLLSVYNTIITTLSKSIYKKYILYYNSIDIFTAVLYVTMILLNGVSLIMILVIQILNTTALILVQKRLIRQSLAE